MLLYYGAMEYTPELLEFLQKGKILFMNLTTFTFHICFTCVEFNCFQFTY